MMQLRHRTLTVMLVLASLPGWLSAPSPRQRGPGGAPGGGAAVDAPILPVQMPLTTGSFSKEADLVKPAVININTVSQGWAARVARRSRNSSGEEFYRPVLRRSAGTDSPAQPGLGRHHRLRRRRADERPRGQSAATRSRSSRLAGASTREGRRSRQEDDLAVLRLDDGKGKFPSIRLGDSDRCRSATGSSRSARHSRSRPR